MKEFIYYYFLFYFFIKIINSENIIFVDYNIKRNYNSFDECGSSDQPICTSFEDAINKVILISINSLDTPTIYINIIGDINGTNIISLGNLYNFCGTLYIRSNSSNSNINIDGTNSTQQPFLIIQEPDEINLTISKCTKKRVFIFQRLNFINWDQTIISININQEINDQPIDQSKFFQILMVDTFIISSSSIIFVNPKNSKDLFKNYNFKGLQFYFTTSYCINMKSSKLLAPNSTDNFLPPIYIIGGSIIRFFNIQNSSILSTPFIYIKSGSLEFVNDISISNNNFSIYPIVLLINSKFSTLKTISFNENEFFTFFLFYECQTQPITPINFFNNIQPHQSNYQRKLYLGIQLENSVTVIKNSHFTIQEYLKFTLNLNNTIGNDIFYVENSNFIIQFLGLERLIQGNHMIKVINSIVTFQNIDLKWDGFPIIGSNSTIDFIYCKNLNNSFCGCSTCNFLNQSFNCDFSSSTASSFEPTETPTLSETNSPTNTQTPPTITETPTHSKTNTPTNTQTPKINETQPFITNTPTPTQTLKKSNKNRNIAIIVVTIVLGVTSIVSLLIFSIYKRYNSKLSIRDNDNMFGAGDEKAFSPSFDIVTPNINEDCGQKEGL
ncbi:hypothetical protein DDB_G0285423 [Dictyostelium discoideum AX4]|uniref:Transmembrane protein n=1 Tax=Dictyostelium discoideum TaxID=44689 RepID=Q54MW1_DICDI|nr:hypothetical protein DDB_G0285423 [Dictyostelium discoideum AX4]EAL64549.1 hypothetical protein DDB_G0285423 [Dictyostelium discoideum AX4]|eukprot:XP_638182.1 hypothetical protein DDB_G0285423 [Dictyostelium discoideum AX4]